MILTRPSSRLVVLRRVATDSSGRSVSILAALVVQRKAR